MCNKIYRKKGTMAEMLPGVGFGFCRNGNVYFDLKTGIVLHKEVLGTTLRIPEIVMFDMAEYEKRLGAKVIPYYDMDDLAYWYLDDERLYYKEPNEVVRPYPEHKLTRDDEFDGAIEISDVTRRGIVCSSHGNIAIDVPTGIVYEIELLEGGELPCIVRFDIEEYERYWGEPATAGFDVLDLGFWCLENGFVSYEGPEMDFRNDIKKEKTCRR